MYARTITLLTGGLLVLVTGCSGTATYKVVGTVTWEGNEVEDGQITFLPEDGNLHPATAKIVNGGYEARVPAGKMKVEISAQRDLGYDKVMRRDTLRSRISRRSITHFRS